MKLDLHPLRYSGSRTVRWLVTDDQGRFSGLVNPGPIRFSFSLHDMPQGYFLPPQTQHWVDFEVKEGEERHEFTPPRLRKGVLVRGKVVDDEGKPAAMVDVTGHWISAEFGAIRIRSGRRPTARASSSWATSRRDPRSAFRRRRVSRPSRRR